jgi:arylformamidase
MSAHTGTHIDAPCHFIDGGRTIDQLDLSLLVGDVEVIAIDKENNIISKDTLSGLGIKQWPQRVIFKTNNSYRELMKNNEFYKDFVALSVDGSKYLIKQGVLLIGIDYLSIAPFENGDETHIELLKHEVVVIEGLNLVNIKPGSYQLIALPINLKGADGAPARVLLIAE